MPIYEYKCAKCESVFSELRGISSRDSEIRCSRDTCAGTGSRLVSATSFILKGAGWAQDGYKSTASTDGYAGCTTKKQRLQRAAEIGDAKPD